MGWVASLCHLGSCRCQGHLITPTPITLPSFPDLRLSGDGWRNRHVSAILHTELQAEPMARAPAGRLTLAARSLARGNNSVAKSAPARAAIALGDPAVLIRPMRRRRRHFKSEGFCISQEQGFSARLSARCRPHRDGTAATPSMALGRATKRRLRCRRIAPQVRSAVGKGRRTKLTPPHSCIQDRSY